MITCIFKDFFPYENANSKIFNQIAARCSKHGIKLTVYTGKKKTGFKKTNEFQSPNVSVIRLPFYRSKKTSLIFRSAEDISFAFVVFFVLLFKKNNLTLIPSTPFLITFIAPILKLIRNRKYIFINFDIYPEVIANSGVVSEKSIVYKILHKLSIWVIKKAESVWTITDAMAVRLKEKTGRESMIIYLWADTKRVYPTKKENNPLIKKHGLEKQFTINIPGRFGQNYNFDTILEATKKLSNIKFIFIGDGFFKDKIKRAEKNQKNIIVEPFLPENKITHSVSSGDLALIPQSRGINELSFPSRIYDILASATPIIAITPTGSEVYTFIKKSQCGYTIEPNDTDSLIKTIRQVADNPAKLKALGENGLHYIQTRYNHEDQIKKVCKHLKEFE